MHIIITTATEKELNIIEKELSSINNHNIVFKSTGIGPVATTYNMCRLLSNSEFDLAINMGLAGSYRDGLHKGTVVGVTDDVFAYTVKRGDSIKALFDYPLPALDVQPACNWKQFSIRSLDNLPKVRSLTVSSLDYTRQGIQMKRKIFNPDIETMEGAAFFYVCCKQNIPFLQIRAVSNFIEEDREKWIIEKPLYSLNKVLKDVLREL
jgi:futalosine hydrolase